MEMTPFDIPLLNNGICQYLSPKDLARCVQVSKAWSDWFTPALWRDLDCHIRLPYVYVHTFARQQEQVRTMRNITMTQAGSVFAQAPCTNLQRLEFKDEEFRSIRSAQLRVLRILEKMSTLRHLQIKLALNGDRICQQWIRALEALHHLESLSLTSVFMDGKIFQKILPLCTRYKRLALYISKEEVHLQKVNKQEYLDAKAAIERIPEMQLRELSFHSYLQLYDENILRPLLDRCPKMEKLDVKSDEYLSPLLNAIKEKRLPKLRHFTMAELWSKSVEDSIALLSYVESGVESFEVDTLNRSIIQSLIKYHHQSLRTLAFRNSTELLFWEFSDLLASLPNLQSVRAGVCVREGDGTNDAPLKHWECGELRSLRLVMESWTFRCVMGSPEWEGSMHKRCLNHLFSEVAKLKGLRELRIGYQRELYLMKSGYLTRLADLKQLEVFDLARTPPVVFGKDEALWMADNWPRLTQVYSHGASEDFRRTLLEKQPQIEIIN
ncbi:hypothetical protein BGX34_002575 [Mortierella sp. NVP85]|nr:hypothetical protein BGX34_002575 [Mortierella sp. NVP85]